ncbi:MAG: hypothetical protein ACYC5Q_13345 [Thermoleophilia bacterium]
MKRLSTILFQLGEGCRYIDDGREDSLRLALLLLDNAAEIQMDWAVRFEMSWVETRERMREMALRIPEPDRPPSLQELVEWKPLTKSRRAAIDRFFDEKVAFLSTLPEKFNPALAAPLKHLHKYRNQAFHRGEVRRDTLDISCRLLVEINCDLVQSLPVAFKSLSSAEDYSWLEQRYGDVHQLFGDDEFIERATTELRERVFVDDAAVAAALAEHLRARVHDLVDDLDFILENARGFDSREEVLRTAQYFANPEASEASPTLMPPVTYRPPITLQSIQALLGRTSEIGACRTRIAAFAAYSLLEKEIERVEPAIQEAVMQIDMAIQQAIDESRGK